jgi:DNA polymerase beta
MTDFNTTILDYLKALRGIEHKNRQFFKVKAYTNVIKQIEVFTNPIKSFKDIEHVQGIGNSIKSKLVEIFEKGGIQGINASEIHHERIIDQLTSIHGIGPIKARELVLENKVTCIDDLKTKTELLNDIQIMGLKYHTHFLTRISFQEMQRHEAYLTQKITMFDNKLQIQVVGSYRRGSKDSGDIDVIVTHMENPSTYDHIIPGIVDMLRKDAYLVDDFAIGKHKYLGVCRLKRHHVFRRIDILYATKNVWPFSLLYFTGSKDFNVLLRNIALTQGYSLSEYGLKHTKEKNKGNFVKTEFTTEEDVLKFLGYRYIEPKLRNSDLDMSKYKL